MFANVDTTHSSNAPRVSGPVSINSAGEATTAAAATYRDTSLAVDGTRRNDKYICSWTSHTVLCNVHTRRQSKLIIENQSVLVLTGWTGF